MHIQKKKFSTVSKFDEKWGFPARHSCLDHLRFKKQNSFLIGSFFDISERVINHVAVQETSLRIKAGFKNVENIGSVKQAAKKLGRNCEGQVSC